MSLAFLDLFNLIFKFVVVLFIGLYRSFGTQFFGGNCRFEPSCSAYCLEAFNKFDLLSALKLSIHRISKCHPLSKSFGYDPLPKLDKDCNCKAKYSNKNSSIENSKDNWTWSTFSEINSTKLSEVNNGK